MTEFGFAVVDYVKDEPANEFTPFVEEYLLTLPADKSIEFDPFPDEKSAKKVLTLIQRAANSTAISARRRALHANEDGTWTLAVGASPRGERKPRKPRTAK